MANKKDITPEVTTIATIDSIQTMIHVIRNERVMLDKDLATLYGVELSQLNRQVKRNIERFPSDFMFQLNNQEFANLKCQNGIARWGGDRQYNNLHI